MSAQKPSSVDDTFITGNILCPPMRAQVAVLVFVGPGLNEGCSPHGPSYSGVFTRTATARQCKMGDDPEPVHTWFELSYARYLSIPRSVLQSMPIKWQRRFVMCLNELDGLIDWRPKANQQYKVNLHERTEVYDPILKRNVETWGHRVYDSLEDYERGRRRIKCINEH